ncbi:MAG: SDR family oxidoreductase [Clostridiaceae bacterium]|jgi:NAD(P)-dependent dehydrogenase (short-subunit alcohol dehydrogenase family)|nr:SDR family oxidoreductase [Clostridiaceae bacterium]
MSKNDKVIIVTGASSGLGSAVAKCLADAGYTVFAGARSYKGTTLSDNNNLKKVYLDVTDQASIDSFINNIISQKGKIDVLINCAAMLVLGSVEDTAIDEYEKVLNTNLIGTIRMCKAVLPHMRDNHSGLIINFSSIMGLLAIPFQSAYSASKFAIEGFTEALSMETKEFGIKVTLIEPTDHKSGSQKYRPHALLADDSGSAYRDVFLKVTSKIEYDESHGSEPESLANFVKKIIQCKNPKLRYKVGKFDQRLSVLLKRILPGRIFESVIYSYYNSGK